jgi:hypothetical protein
MRRSEVLYNCSLFGWEADCRRGYIRKAFPKNYSGLEFGDAVRIDIPPEEFTDLEKGYTRDQKMRKILPVCRGPRAKESEALLRE